MNSLTFEDQKPLSLTLNTYKIVENAVYYAGTGMLMGHLFRWYSPMHGALMGACASLPRLLLSRYQSNLDIDQFRPFSDRLIKSTAENNIEEVYRLTVNAIFAFKKPLLEQLALYCISYGSPLVASYFGYSTTPWTVLTYLASSYVASAALFPIAHYLLKESMLKVGVSKPSLERFYWWKQYGIAEWLTRPLRTKHPLPVRLTEEGLTKLPPKVDLKEFPADKIESLLSLCDIMNWGQDDPHRKAIENALSEMNEDIANGRLNKDFYLQIIEYLKNIADILEHEDVEFTSPVLKNLAQGFTKACRPQWFEEPHKQLLNLQCKGFAMEGKVLKWLQDLKIQLIVYSFCRFYPQSSDVHFGVALRRQLSIRLGLEIPMNVDGDVANLNLVADPFNIAQWLRPEDLVKPSAAGWEDLFKQEFTPEFILVGINNMIEQDKASLNVFKHLTQLVKDRLKLDNELAEEFVYRHYLNQRSEDAGSYRFTEEAIMSLLKSFNIFEAKSGSLFHSSKDNDALIREARDDAWLPTK